MTNFKDYLEKYAKLLPVTTSVSFVEAEKRSSQFLEATAMITEWRHTLGSEKIKAISIQTVVYSSELSKGTAKTMTENKVLAEASKEYLSARESLEGIENDSSYLKSYYDIFMAAHIFYRQMARGESV